MASPERPVIGFLTDFGLDGAAATCRGVMLGICRDAQIIDIAHTIRKYAVRDGAYILRFALPYLPVGVHVGVVDPGVGTDRRPIGIRTGRGDVLIGPDNGLLVSPAEALGGVIEARELTNRDLWLPVTTSTFHGRDIFAPVAAHVAAGEAPFEAVGPVLHPAEIVRLAEPAARVSEGGLETQVTYVDSFGNVRLAGGRAELEAAFGTTAYGDRFDVRIGGAPIEKIAFAPSFGHVAGGAAVLYVDSSGNLAVAVNQGSMAERVRAESGVGVTIVRV